MLILDHPNLNLHLIQYPLLHHSHPVHYLRFLQYHQWHYNEIQMMKYLLDQTEYQNHSQEYHHILPSLSQLNSMKDHR